MTRASSGRLAIDPTVTSEFLRHLHRRHFLQSWAGVIGGAFLALLGPLCVLLFYLLISMSLIASYGFWKSYSILAGVTLPIFFLLAWYLRGSVLERWVPDGDSLSGRFMRRTVAPALIILEIANSGPRLVIWGAERLLHQRRFTDASLPRAADAIALLFKSDSGVSPAALLNPGEPADLLTPLLGFLMHHQLIDISKQGDRVWLTSQARTDLQKLRSGGR
jgi:hypothetical protein